MLYFRWIGCGDIFIGVPPTSGSGGGGGHHRVRVAGHNPSSAYECAMALYRMQPHPGPFFEGTIHGDGPRRYPSTWCLVATALEGWSFDGTPYPGRYIVDRTACVVSGAAIRHIMGTLRDIVGCPPSNTERGHIEHTSDVRIRAMRWLHILQLGSLAAGPRWHYLAMAANPLPRGTRIESMQTARCAQHLLADANIASRRLRSPMAPPCSAPPPVAALAGDVFTKATKLSMGGESVRYIGWLSGVVRVLLEECVIFLTEERRTAEYLLPVVIGRTGILEGMPPDAQCQWLETWEATDRQAVLEDAWTAWVRQCCALHRAHRDAIRHWELFAFTASTYGFDRLSLFEQARISGVFLWAWTFIERIQMITLHAVAHFTPQLGASERAAFCRFTATTLLDFCGP